MNIGDPVRYVDPSQVEHNALVTAVWGAPENGEPSLNVVYVSGDTTQTDQYGRQIARNTSVPHQDNQRAPGNYWK